jgi:DNA-binding MurR/RpiR family transcriptional regulator
MPAMNVKDAILERFTALPPKMREAARFVLDHPNEVVVLSMRGIAERSGVQPATFVRLARLFGYSGWPELKVAFAADMGLQTAQYGQRAKDLAIRGADSRLLGEFFAAQHENLDATEAKCAPTLRDVATALARARAVHVAGFRACFPVACSLAYGYRLFRNSVHLVDGHGGGLEMQLRLVEARDAVVVASFAPYSREALFVVETAKRAGARVVALTDSQASPLALEAHQTLLFAAGSPSFFPSVAAAVALTEALLEHLVVEAGAAGVKKLEASESQLFEAGAYLQRPQRRHS